MSSALAIVLAALAPADDAAPRVTVPDVDASAQVGAPEPDPAVRAGELFRDGEFAQAAAAFQTAYERTGDPAFLFGRAQALRRAGNCGAAIEVFEAFIAASPPEADVQAAQDVIAACRSILGEDASEPAPDEPQVEPAPQVEPEPRPPARWHRDLAGGVLLGSGLAVAAAGGALYGTAFARASDRMETEQAYEARQRQVRTLGAAGVGLMITGGALLVGSIVRYVIVARRDRAGGDDQARWAAPLTWRF
jgi:hypothetical protein